MFRTSQGSQFFRGKYYKNKVDVEGSFFRYTELVERRQSFGTIINNLIADQTRYTIETNWDLGFKPRGYVVGKDGERYIIEEVVKMQQEVNPQTRYWLKNNQDTTYVLSLTRIDNIEERQ